MKDAKLITAQCSRGLLGPKNLLSVKFQDPALTLGVAFFEVGAYMTLGGPS